MDRSTFMQTLPFLHLVSNSDTGLLKLHRDHILDYIISSQPNTSTLSSTRASNRVDKNGRDKKVNCIFSNLNHLVSIEPNPYHCDELGKPAFFIPSACSEEDHENEDPALTGFGAYLLPVHIHNASPLQSSIIQGNGKTGSPFRYQDDNDGRKHQQTSPAASSASTSISTPLGGIICSSSNGGKFEVYNSIETLKNNKLDHHDNNESVDEDNESCVKTFLLYFSFSRHYIKDIDSDDNDYSTSAQDVDIYFVDHQRIQSLEIVPGSGPLSLDQDINEREHQQQNHQVMQSKESHTKPTSLLLKFDACNFRVIGKGSLFLPTKNGKEQTVTTESDMISIEQEFLTSFDIMKSCITSHKEKLHLLKYDPCYMTDFSFSSFYTYLSSIFVSPFKPEEQESQSTQEYGQVEKSLTTDDDTTSKSNKTNSESHLNDTDETIESGKIEENDRHESTNDATMPQRIQQGRKRKIRSYEQSWNVLEMAADMTKSKAINEINNIDKKRWSSLFQKSAIQLGNSFVVDDHLGILPEDSSFSSRNVYQHDLEMKICDIQKTIDKQIQTIFSSSGGRSFTIMKPPPESETKVSVKDIESELQKYRQAVAARHHLMFLPSR